MPNTAENKNVKKSHLHLLLELARADKRMHINEDKFMRKVADRIGLTDEEFDEVKFYPDRFQFTLPTTEAERFKCFIDLLNLMKVDDDIDRAEIDFVKRIGLIMGINVSLTEDLIEIMEKYIGLDVPEEIITEATQKYLN